MEKNKVITNVEIEADQQEWLAHMATEYDLADSSKALRVILDYAMKDLDADGIFMAIRCRRCG